MVTLVHDWLKGLGAKFPMLSRHRKYLFGYC